MGQGKKEMSVKSGRSNKSSYKQMGQIGGGATLRRKRKQNVQQLGKHGQNESL